MTTFQDEGAVYNRVKQDLSVYNFKQFPTFDEMSGYIGEEIGDARLPYLDRKTTLEAGLTEDQKYWRENGYIIFRNFIPHELIDRYLDLRRRANLGRHGWPNLAPYDSFPEIRELNLYKPLMQRVEKMLGYRLALHFNLSGFTSTERGWHQDDYMCDPLVAASGCAMWFALDDIHPDAGPFEFVPGSHRWPIMRREKVLKYLTREAADNSEGKHDFWAHLAEYYVNPACEEYMRRRGAKQEYFLAKKGDVLVWHGGLVHRGSHPRNNDLERPTIISHYCDPNRHEISEGVLTKHRNGELYFSFPNMPKLVVADGKVGQIKPEKTVLQTWLKPMARKLKKRVRRRLEQVIEQL